MEADGAIAILILIATIFAILVSRNNRASNLRIREYQQKREHQMQEQLKLEKREMDKRLEKYRKERRVREERNHNSYI
tara:strand:- start:79847 stop:80080 length:234 start_codon:yes stop_codon:yes gene_type:complete